MGIEGGKFLDRKYQDLTGSHAVERAVTRARVDEDRDFAPHSREERVEAYLSRLENIIEDDRGRRLLKRKLIEEFTIDTDNQEVVEKIARGLYEAEKRIAINQGRGGDVAKLNETQGLEQYRSAVFEKQEIQEKTLTAWLDYLAQNDAGYPTWFQYFVVRNLGKMGVLNKEKGEYNKRTEYTVAPFPEINSEALGFVYRMLTTGIGSHEFIPDQNQTPQEQQITIKKREQLMTLIEKQDFAKLYVFAQLETAGNSNRESLVGEWVKYEKGSDPNVLEAALRGKGTGWCTAEGSARKHLNGGDFYVYFTKGSKGVYSEPRIAIRMLGDMVTEVRGVNPRQELEPALVETAQAKYKELPGGENFEKKSNDMQRLTTLVQKQEKGILFTREDLRFLYEVDDMIEGFGYVDDPRVAELRNCRDRQKDIETLCDCSPEAIAYNFSDITLSTQVYCHETGKKHSYGDFRRLSFLDFREEDKQKKLPQIVSFNEALRLVNIEASLDTLMEGGIIDLSISSETRKALQNYDTAIEAYRSADTLPLRVDGECRYMSWDAPESDVLQVFVLEKIPDSFAERDTFIDAMEDVGYRMIEFSELVALGIERPDLTKQGIKYLYGRHEYVDYEDNPVIPFSGYNSVSGERFISTTDEPDVDDYEDRFLFIKYE